MSRTLLSSLLLRVAAPAALVAASLGSAHALTNDSKLGVLDSSTSFIVASVLDTDSAYGTTVSVVKRGPSSNITWHARYTPPVANSQGTRVVEVRVDGSNNVYVLGYGANSGGSTYFLVKYSSGGTQQWAKTYGSSLLGGRVSGLAVDASGNAYVVGSYLNAQVLRIGKVLKYDSGGSLLYDRTIQVYGSVSNATCDNVAIAASGDVYVSGTADDNNNADPENALLVRFSPSLVQAWTATSPIAPQANNTGLVLDSTGAAYTTYDGLATSAHPGSYPSYALRNGPDASPTWKSQLPAGMDSTAGLILDTNGAVVVGGFQRLTTGAMNCCFGMAMLASANGGLQANLQDVEETNGGVSAVAVAQDANGRYLVGGTYAHDPNVSSVCEAHVAVFTSTSQGYYYFAPNNQNRGTCVCPSSLSGELFVGGTTRPGASGTPYYPMQTKLEGDTDSWLYWYTG